MEVLLWIKAVFKMERTESTWVLPGFWLRPEWLWQADSQDPLFTFCEMAGLPEAVVNQFREQIRDGFTG